MTDMAFESCVAGQQVFGGHGYIREWGQEQLVRDVRISQIYEGTNGIQAMDLLGRKVVANGGTYLRVFVDEMNNFILEYGDVSEMKEFITTLQRAIEKLSAATQRIFEEYKTDAQAIGAAAADYLAIFGYVSYA